MKESRTQESKEDPIPLGVRVNELFGAFETVASFHWESEEGHNHLVTSLYAGFGNVGKKLLHVNDEMRLLTTRLGNPGKVVVGSSAWEAVSDLIADGGLWDLSVEVKEQQKEL